MDKIFDKYINLNNPPIRRCSYCGSEFKLKLVIGAAPVNRFNNGVRYSYWKEQCYCDKVCRLSHIREMKDHLLFGIYTEEEKNEMLKSMILAGATKKEMEECLKK